MGGVKGKFEYKKWEKGVKLTRKQTMLAQCYICNGEEDGRMDCQGKDTCPMYPYFSYKGKTS